MSLSKTLQSPEVLQQISGKSLVEIRELFLEIGHVWYEENPEEEHQIRTNLEAIGITFENQTVEQIKENIIYHYAEKVLPLAGTVDQFSTFLDENVDYEEAKLCIVEAQKKGGVLIATPHFGGVELVVPTIARMGVKANAVLKFSTQNLSDKAHLYADKMTSTGLFAPISFIELGKPNSNGALEMAAALRRGEVLFTVFDEETGYSVPATLFGKTVEGGAGLDKLLKFSGASVSAYNVFMIRTGVDTFKMQLVAVDLTSENPIQSMYDNLELILREHLVQWYFLHEEIPFVENVEK